MNNIIFILFILVLALAVGMAYLVVKLRTFSAPTSDAPAMGLLLQQINQLQKEMGTGWGRLTKLSAKVSQLPTGVVRDVTEKIDANGRNRKTSFGCHEPTSKLERHAEEPQATRDSRRVLFGNAFEKHHAARRISNAIRV